jgi:hydroxymethylpyrimidine pyrophosphatase-like HAD family hydrolase
VALARAAARLGVAQSDCVAFGDSFNDREMLEWAGVGVAVGNARPELKAVADRIGLSADDDGVAEMLKELFP